MYTHALYEYVLYTHPKISTFALYVGILQEWRGGELQIHQATAAVV